MALSTTDQKLAARWWVGEMFKKPKKVAATHVAEIMQAIADGDAWVGAAPAGGATNGAAFKTAIDSGFRTKLSDAGFVVNDAVALLFAAIGLARAGKLPGQ